VTTEEYLKIQYRKISKKKYVTTETVHRHLKTLQK
jgi:hypothetical protein